MSEDFENISVPEAATRMGISQPRLRRLLLDNRIPGAERVGSRERGEWIITVPVGKAPVRRRALNQAQQDAEEAADREAPKT